MRTVENAITHDKGERVHQARARSSVRREIASVHARRAGAKMTATVGTTRRHSD
jgi:hypothetical protein